MAIWQQGMSQQTPAVLSILRSASAGSASRRSFTARKSSKRKSSSKKTRTKSAKSSRSGSKKKRAARLVKGSAAAKRYMASIRKKRGK